MEISSCYFELEIARAPIVPKNDLERHTDPNLEHPAPSPEYEQIQQNLFCSPKLFMLQSLFRVMAAQSVM
jgi:hypothetical protein